MAAQWQQQPYYEQGEPALGGRAEWQQQQQQQQQQRVLRPQPPQDPSGGGGRVARHQAKQHRRREQATQPRQDLEAQAVLLEALEAERNARRMLEERLATQEQHGWEPHPQHLIYPHEPRQPQRAAHPPQPSAPQPQTRWHADPPAVVKGGGGGDAPAPGAYISRTQYEMDLQKQIQDKQRREAEAAAREAEEDRRAEERFNRQQAEIEAKMAAEAAEERAKEEARQQAVKLAALRVQQARGETSHLHERVAVARSNQQPAFPRFSINSSSPRSSLNPSPRTAQRLMRHRFVARRLHPLRSSPHAAEPTLCVGVGG